MSSASQTICEGNPPVTGESLSERARIAGFHFFSLTLACTSCWRNCLVADDMRRDDVCDASVMELSRKRCRTMRPPVTNREQTKDKHNLGTTSGTGLHWSNHIDLMSKPKQSKTRQNKARPDKPGWRPVTKVSPVFENYCSYYHYGSKLRRVHNWYDLLTYRSFSLHKNAFCIVWHFVDYIFQVLKFHIK